MDALTYRLATKDDLFTIIQLLADDTLGATREKGCHLLQLTSDKKRPDAIRFYESLGFVATHEGMKLKF